MTGANGEPLDVKPWKIGSPHYIKIAKEGAYMQKDFTQTYHYALNEAFGPNEPTTEGPISSSTSFIYRPMARTE